MSPEKKKSKPAEPELKETSGKPSEEAACPAEEEATAVPCADDQTAKKLEELNDKYLRLLAEYDNYRKRTQTEKESIYSDAYCAAVSQLLPIFDNLDRAALCEDSDGLKKGLELVVKQSNDIFEKIGVAEIPANGETFDPNLHDAVLHTEDDAKGQNEVVEVLQKGYTLKGRVIRHSMVKVAN